MREDYAFSEYLFQVLVLRTTFITAHHNVTIFPAFTTMLCAMSKNSAREPLSSPSITLGSPAYMYLFSNHFSEGALARELANADREDTLILLKIEKGSTVEIESV